MMFAVVLSFLLAAPTVAEWEDGTRPELLEWFRANWFGRAPVEKPADEVCKERSLECAGGQIKINFHLTLPAGADAKHPVPVFVFGDHFNRQTSVGNKSVYPGIPTNSITAHGYAYVCVNFNDVCLNTYDTPEFNGSFTQGVHRVYGCGKPDSWGSLGAWAWCFSRTMDWIESRPELDATRVAIVGHSRGGKAALWAGARDPRIALTISNNSGAGGAALLGMSADEPQAEKIADFTDCCVEFWFAKNFMNYARREKELPHDADDLLKLIAPRLLYVASSSEDVSACPKAEFAAAKRARAVWSETYGQKTFALDELPPTNTWDHTGAVAYHLKAGRHSLTAWDWERYLDYADRHLKAKDEMPALATAHNLVGTYEARPPRLAPEQTVASGAFGGRVVDLYTRLRGETAVGPEARQIALSAWRNERVHAQTVVWSGKDRAGLRAEISPLVGPGGATLPASAVKARFIRYVLGTDHRFERLNPVESYPDCLDTVERLDLPAQSFRPVWLTVEVPPEAKPGAYAGALTLRVNGGEKIDFPIALEVSERALPAAKDRQFYLDLWQHPLGVARYHGVKPFSPEHYALLDPLYRELASAGQKVITATITDYPWGGGDGTAGAYGSEFALNPIRGMVTYVKKTDGSYAADFSLFDEYVSFCKACGLGPRINCYTIVKFARRETYQYVDEATGDLVSVKLPTGSAEWKAYMRPLIKLVASHLKEKGWFADAAIAIDEAPPAKAKIARDFLKEVEPDFQFALAGNVTPAGFKEIDIDDYSQILWHDYDKGDTFMTDEFLASLRPRAAAGKKTTFYVCSIPGVHKPNNWLSSDLIESEWIGLYAAAKGFSGFLRWAVVYWPRDPFFDASYATHPAGETFFLYPGCRSSMRWEILRDGFEDWEKIRLLREAGEASPELERVLDALDFPSVETAPERVFRRQVAEIRSRLN